MTSSVTVWTSSATAHAQTRVAQIISATREAGDAYDSISIVGCDVAECKDLLGRAFNRLVSMSMTDSALHILAVIPMYEDNTAAQIQTLYDACSSLEHNITLHIIGLASGIKPIFDVKADDSIEISDYKKSIGLLKSLCEEASLCISYSLIDNYAENGAPVGFTVESLSQYIALIQTALMRDYYKILSPALLAAHNGDNLSIGVASLSFNRIAATRQILGLGFLEALENVGINNIKVDAQKAVHEAESILTGIAQRYPKLFEHSLRPLYKEDKQDEGRVVAKASSILDDDINSLRDEILSLLKSDKLSLPEKEAVLAMILGRDNENISGMQYVHEGALLDDACEQPINFYVEAFNHCCKGSGLLPVRGEFEALKKFVWNDSLNEFEESFENIEAINPLSDIKRLKQEILNSTSFIRDKQDELNHLQKAVKQRKDVEDIRRKWQKPNGTLKDIEYKEQPLDEQYRPAPGLRIKGSVDLRKFFTPVKNQLNLGSCTSFAAVAMYEAMMNQAGVDGCNDMSPAYLYFYSNILKGRPAGGSNFHEQLEVLGTHGVCHEDLYIYDADSPDAKPSAQAEEDAKKHRVLSAKQIPLFNGADKSAALKHNHTLLTSALSEGYPIGISLKIYDNLGSDGAFILHPDDIPNAKEDGWHAMVIVGYSEENNIYIVRNSWGTEFGENGYCYIPMAYIDDPDYMDFACIITEISDNADIAKADVPTVVANFAATESEIRIAAIRNAIAKIRIDLKNYQKLYTEYYKYYQRLIMQLTMPKVQNDIRSAAEIAQTSRYINVEEKKRELEDSFVEKFKNYKKYLRKIIAYLFAITLIFGFIWHYSRSYLTLFFFSFFATLCCLAAFGYKWWKRIKRRNLQEELDQVAVDAKRQAEQLLEMQIRFHVAGMWLNRFHKLSLEINNVYDRLVSYNSSLRAWQQEYSRQICLLETPKGQMFRALDASPLLQSFFEHNKSSIIKEVDFIKIFEDYQVNPDHLEKFHLNLQKTVSSVIESLMADFNITNFLLGDEYPYLKPVNLQDEISSLINVGQSSYRNRAMNATSSIHILIGNIPHERENQWTSKINPLFPMHPVQLHSPNPNSLILLTIHPVN